MAKTQTKVSLKDKPAEIVGGYKVLATTKDGVRLLKPKGKASSRFSEQEIRNAVMSVRAAKSADDQ
jgi:hypothetical protein